MNPPKSATHLAEFVAWCRKVGLKPETTETQHSTQVTFPEGNSWDESCSFVEATFVFNPDGTFRMMGIG